MSIIVVQFRSGADIEEFAEAYRKAQAYDFAGWQFFPKHRTVKLPDGSSVRLSPNQSRILHALVREWPNRITLRNLSARLEVSIDSARVNMFNLRKRLDDPGRINTDHWLGYCFVPPTGGEDAKLEA